MKLTEAFKALDALNEDTFSVSDDGVSKLSAFMQDDGKVDEISVIDPEAETEDDIQDSYVGKVILDCKVCHSKLYKDKEEIELDEEQTSANVGEECPYCYTTDGYNIIGEVAAFENMGDGMGTKLESTRSVGKSLIPAPYNKYFKVSNYEPDVSSSEYTIGDKIDNFELVAYLDPKAKYEDVFDSYPMLFVDNQGSKIVATVSHGRVYELDLENYRDFLFEAVNNVNVETDDSVVNVSTEDDGKVVVTTEPKAIDSQVDGETIIPLTDETQAAIEGTSDTDLTDEPTVDAEIEEFDGEAFDNLGESYFKDVYSNVESYKTEKVKVLNDSKLVVEGWITFTSGSKKKTSFLFEAKDCTRSGKYRFIGENRQLTRGKKAFTISGALARGKFVTECFNYNYKSRDSKGKSTRIYGTLRNRKGRY